MVRAAFYSVLATLLLAGACLLPARAQDASQTPAATPAAAGKSPAKKDAQAKPETADAAHPNGSSDAGSSGAAPAQQNAPKRSNAEDNPFPEELSRSAAKAAAADAAPAADGVSSSRSVLDGSDPNLEAADAPAAPAREEAPPLHDPKRAAKDRDVGKFYLDSGDYVGAYKRLKDALAENPEDPEAAYYLAEAARKVNLTEEAIKSYQLVLDLDPEGRKARAARKALEAIAADRKQ